MVYIRGVGWGVQPVRSSSSDGGLKMIRVGNRVNTAIGFGTVTGREWVSGTGSRRKQVFKVRWDRDGSEGVVSKRRLTMMMAGRNQNARPEEPEAEERSEPKQTEVTKVPTLPSDIGDKNLAQMLADVIGPYVTGKLDRDEVVSLIDERIHSFTLPRRVEIVTAAEVAKDIGVQHVHFDAVLRLASARLNVWLYGPAGSGKTSIASAIADALELPFYNMSVCQQTTKSDLLGYKNPGTGEYVSTLLREAYENGGVFLLDEVDGGNPNVMMVMNSLIANEEQGFPDGMIRKHIDFRLIAGGNTIGMGANAQYVGRSKLDEATRDRFVLMEFPYDPAIEAVMCGVSPDCFSDAMRPTPFVFHETGDKEDEARDIELRNQVELRCMDYCRQVTQIRNAIDATGVRHIVSPRASKAGCTMLRLGFSLKDTLSMAVWKGLDADSINKIKSRC